MNDYPHMHDVITCRLVKIELPTDEKEILCTSLLDHEIFTHDDKDELYHCVWNEEEAYKLLKNRVEVENFSDNTTQAVNQDFHAKFFLMSLCAAYAHPKEEPVMVEYKADQTRKFDQKINRTNALSMTPDVLLMVLIWK